jgi:hypothetical protein
LLRKEGKNKNKNQGRGGTCLLSTACLIQRLSAGYRIYHTIYVAFICLSSSVSLVNEPAPPHPRLEHKRTAASFDLPPVRVAYFILTFKRCYQLQMFLFHPTPSCYSSAAFLPQ